MDETRFFLFFSPLPLLIFGIRVQRRKRLFSLYAINSFRFVVRTPHTGLGKGKESKYLSLRRGMSVHSMEFRMKDSEV